VSLSNRLEDIKHGFKMYKAIVLSFVVYGCEMLCLVFREEHRWRMPENMVLNRMCRTERERVTG